MNGVIRLQIINLEKKAKVLGYGEFPRKPWVHLVRTKDKWPNPYPPGWNRFDLISNNQGTCGKSFVLKARDPQSGPNDADVSALKIFHGGAEPLFEKRTTVAEFSETKNQEHRGRSLPQTSARLFRTEC